MNFEKVGFDPGHFAGANVGPGTYREGDVMLKLGLMLQKKYGAFLTRTDGKDLSFPVRSAKAKTAGCNTLISLHTNAPEAARGIIIFYSMKHSEDKAMAEYIGQELSRASGISFRGANTRPSVSYPTQDYYGMIRNPVNQGIEHVFIIEHGSHWEMAVDTDKKLNAIVECYGRILGLIPKEMTIDMAIDHWTELGVISDPTGMKNDFVSGNIRPDRFKYFIIKSAKFLKGEKIL
jgi:hypothetical protein